MKDYTYYTQEGDAVSLPAYTMCIAEEIEQVTLFSDSDARFRDKLKKMYTFLSSLLGESELVDLIGEFKDVDPNVVNIMFLGIVDTYNSPLTNYSNDKIASKIDESQLNKVAQLVESTEKLKAYK